MTDVRPYMAAGELKTSRDSFEVKSPYDDDILATVARPNETDIEAATAAAASTFQESRKLPVHARAEALVHVSQRLSERGMRSLA